MIISWNKQHELSLNIDADERMRVYFTEDWRKEDNDSYTPRLRRIELEALISWMGTGCMRNGFGKTEANSG